MRANEIKLKYQLIAVGRARYYGQIEGTESQLRAEVKKHLASKLFDIEWEGNEANVVVGGLRVVGKVRLIQ